MKEQRRIEVNGSEAPVTVLVCDCGCQSVIDFERECVVVEHTAIALQHPDGHDEYVHESNESRGRVRYFRLPCYARGGAGSGSARERARCVQRYQERRATRNQAKVQEP